MGSLGETIKKKRISLNLSQAEMGDRVGISGQLLGQYETGKRQPKTKFYLRWKSEFLEDLLEANVSRENNFNEKEAPYKKSKTIKEITRKEITFLKAAVKVLMLKVINLEAAAAKKPFDEVFADVERKIEQEIRRLADEGD